VRVVVLDRPNPIGGALVQGNVPDSVGDPVRERVGFLPVAMRHGLTIGEMLRWANDALAAGAEVRVVPVAGWRRDAYYDALGLPWVPPSPNMPDLESASHYPGLVLFEYTNLSVGRGTPRAFQWIGAPWLDPAAVVAWLREAVPEALAGVNVEETAFTPVSPTDGKYDGVALRGLRFRVTDRARYDPPRLAVALLAALQRIHAATFRFNERPFDRLAMGTTLRRQVLSGLTPQQIWADWAAPLAHYRERRGKYLLY
jgi:uncharacterized protein YbbC (DUF1343 family)